MQKQKFIPVALLIGLIILSSGLMYHIQEGENASSINADNSGSSMPFTSTMQDSQNEEMGVTALNTEPAVNNLTTDIPPENSTSFSYFRGMGGGSTPATQQQADVPATTSTITTITTTTTTESEDASVGETTENDTVNKIVENCYVEETTEKNGSNSEDTEIPEFPTIALPMLAITVFTVLNSWNKQR